MLVSPTRFVRQSTPARRSCRTANVFRRVRLGRTLGASQEPGRVVASISSDFADGTTTNQDFPVAYCRECGRTIDRRVSVLYKSCSGLPIFVNVLANIKLAYLQFDVQYPVKLIGRMAVAYYTGSRLVFPRGGGNPSHLLVRWNDFVKELLPRAARGRFPTQSKILKF